MLGRTLAILSTILAIAGISGCSQEVNAPTVVFDGETATYEGPRTIEMANGRFSLSAVNASGVEAAFITTKLAADHPPEEELGAAYEVREVAVVSLGWEEAHQVNWVGAGESAEGESSLYGEITFEVMDAESGNVYPTFTIVRVIAK